MYSSLYCAILSALSFHCSSMTVSGWVASHFSNNHCHGIGMVAM